MQKSDCFKEYDIRGVLSDELVIELGLKIALKYGSVIVLSDSKKSSKHYKDVFSKAVNNVGCDVIDCGIGPTDLCSVASVKYGLVSVMFTASHLSDDKDGIKFHDKEGIPFSNEMINELKKLKPAKIKEGGVTYPRDLTNYYVLKIIERYHELFSHELTGLKVLLDLRHGSGITELVLKSLHANVTLVNNSGSDPSKISEEFLTKTKNYDLALIHDFDADRLVVVNEFGVVHGSIIACMLSKILRGKVVASIDSSSILSKHASVIYSRVGDPFVIRSVLENKASFGVEPSGHYTDPNFTKSSSGALFAALIAGLIKKKSLNDYLKEFPSVKIEHASIPVSNKEGFMKHVLNKVPNTISSVDGVKFIFNGGTALVRPSGTESIIRFQLENPFKSGAVNDLVKWSSE
jgi:phosphomannomutase